MCSIVGVRQCVGLLRCRSQSPGQSEGTSLGRPSSAASNTINGDLLRHREHVAPKAPALGTSNDSVNDCAGAKRQTTRGGPQAEAGRHLSVKRGGYGLPNPPPRLHHAREFGRDLGSGGHEAARVLGIDVEDHWRHSALLLGDLAGATAPVRRSVGWRAPHPD